MAVAATSAEYAAAVSTCRTALAYGLPVTGADLVLIIRVIEHAVNTLDGLTNADDRTDITEVDGRDGRSA